MRVSPCTVVAWFSCAVSWGRTRLRETQDLDLEDGVVEAERVERFVEQARADDPSGIVVGHRAGEAVIARPSNNLYSFDYPSEVGETFRQSEENRGQIPS